MYVSLRASSLSVASPAHPPRKPKESLLAGYMYVFFEGSFKLDSSSPEKVYGSFQKEMSSLGKSFLAVLKK